MVMSVYIENNAWIIYGLNIKITFLETDFATDMILN